MTPQEAKKELMHINLILAHQMDLARAEKEKNMVAHIVALTVK